jgi:hypothetical protein
MLIAKGQIRFIYRTLVSPHLAGKFRNEDAAFAAPAPPC